MQTTKTGCGAVGLVMGVWLVACGSAPPPMSPDTSSPVATSSSGPGALAAAGAGSAASAEARSHAAATSTDTKSDRGSAEIGAVIQAHRDAFRACYDQAHGRDAKLQGTFVLDFTLNPDGSVKEASYAKDRSEIKDDAMGACVTSVLRPLKFPASERGMESKITYPFGFKPGGGK